ncbi:MAG: hypothetical protein WC371_01445 [Parachlamydiales bacterium]|jgi:tetratricopeptide (TPR) repeat protein
MQQMAKYKKDFALFLEAGFIAINQMDEAAATRLFNAAALLNPENTLTEIGKGYLQLHLLNLKGAAAHFEKVLKQEPDNEMAKTFLGVTLSWQPAETIKGEKILEETANSRDPAVKKISKTAIDFVETFVKKKPSPAEIKKKKK